MDQYRNYIAGDWIESAGVIDNVNPSNVADVIGQYAQADKLQVEKVSTPV